MVDKVSGFINEVKRVTEMYASVFDALLQDSGLAEVSDTQKHIFHLITRHFSSSCAIVPLFFCCNSLFVGFFHHSYGCSYCLSLVSASISLICNMTASVCG